MRLITYLGKTSFILHKQKIDKARRILIDDIMLDTDQYILKNLYNADAETEQLKRLKELRSLLNIFGINKNKQIIFAGDFDIFFNSKLEAKGGKSLPKKKSNAKLVGIKESLDICDIWRIRNPKCQNLTYRQN